ncbi:unnamed protein product [Caenorhabditis auriculariae]|uniref:Reverse transcriptase domain-containing protein n=1 Tax=Caenorhabditis auriculariae TaxID=2777116 RepID=A0A8S1HZ63_9PELO|nr:unnamed protein product [Caenorhabditis auriculariae]
MAANGTPVTQFALLYANRMGGPPSPGKATRITRPQKKAKTRSTRRPQSSARRSRASPVSGAASADEGRSNLGATGYHRNGLRTRHGDCLRFGTLNCRSLASDAAKEQLLAANRNALIDITWPNGELLILGHKVPGKNVGGVGFLVNRSVQHLVDSHEIVNARLGILRLNLGKRGRLTIINVYSPTSPEAESKAKREEKEKELDDFYRKLEETIQREKAYYIFVLGDFNAKMGKCATPSIRHGKHGLGIRNDNGERLAELLDSRRLYHGNSLFEKPERRRWTWKSPNGDTTNEIDHILANRKWSLLDVAVLPSFDVGSDHRLVRAKVRLNQKFLKKDYHQPSRPRRPTYDITTLEEKISEHDWQLLDDPTADYESLCDGLIRCAEPAARPTSSLPPRLDQRAKDLLRRRGEVKRDPQATHLERLTIDKACRMAVQESLANRRRSALLQTAEKRQSLKKKKFELVDERTVMTALKDENGQLKTSRNEMERLTVDFYTELFRSDVPVPRTPTPPPEDEPPILPEEVKYAIRKLKVGTAAGPDNISSELLKAGGDSLYRLLARHFSKYLSEASIPEQWKTSKTILIPKKGDLTDLNNFRPISLLSVVYKLFTKVIVNRLEKQLDNFQPPSQAGFRRNYSCLDHIHALTQVVERHREHQMPLALAFVDYYKAFDSVEINAVLNALASAGVATKYVELIANSNEGTSTTIQLFDKKLSIPIRKGVRQGDTISPKLFSTALEDAMRQLGWDEEHDWEDSTDIRGINIDGKVLTNLRFADDIVLFSSSTTELSSMLNDLDEVGKKIGLKMNGRDLQEVTSYIYLGREVNMVNDLQAEIGRRKRAGWAAFNSIKEVTSQLKDPKLRAHIFEASIIPAISYGTEVWPDTKKKNATALRTSYRALERALIGTTRFEQWKKEQRSTDLRQLSQIRDLEEHIQRGKHRWGGHVIRRQDDRWSTRLTHWIPRNIKRPLGRPPTRWTDYFRKNISQPGRHWMTVAQDRAAWRTCGPR